MLKVLLTAVASTKFRGFFLELYNLCDFHVWVRVVLLHLVVKLILLHCDACSYLYIFYPQVLWKVMDTPGLQRLLYVAVNAHI